MFVQEATDWRQPYLDFLLLPSTCFSVMKIKRKLSRFFVEEVFYFVEPSIKHLEMLVVDEVMRVLKEFYLRVYVKYQGGSKLIKKLICLGYYWPIMEADTASFARMRQACKLTNNRIDALEVELHSLSIPWSFHIWPSDRSYRSILSIHRLGVVFRSSYN